MLSMNPIQVCPRKGVYPCRGPLPRLRGGKSVKPLKMMLAPNLQEIVGG